MQNLAESWVSVQARIPPSKLTCVIYILTCVVAAFGTSVVCVELAQKEDLGAKDMDDGSTDAEGARVA